MAPISHFLTDKYWKLIDGPLFTLQLYPRTFINDIDNDNIDNAIVFDVDIRMMENGGKRININYETSSYRKRNMTDFEFLEKFRQKDGTGDKGFSLSFTGVPLKEVCWAIQVAVSPEVWEHIMKGETTSASKNTKPSAMTEAPNEPCCRCGSRDSFNVRMAGKVYCYIHVL